MEVCSVCFLGNRWPRCMGRTNGGQLRDLQRWSPPLTLNPCGLSKECRGDETHWASQPGHPLLTTETGDRRSLWPAPQRATCTRENSVLMSAGGRQLGLPPLKDRSARVPLNNARSRKERKSPLTSGQRLPGLPWAGKALVSSPPLKYTVPSTSVLY